MSNDSLTRGVPPASHGQNPLDFAKRTAYHYFSREEVIALVRQADLGAGRVVELGCSGGETGKRLKELARTDHYVGVDCFEEAAAAARGKLDQVFVADLQKVQPGDLGIKAQDFDLLVALDVLEHLYDPWTVLATWVTVLRPGAHAVFSIPNVQNVNVLAALAEGHWRYTSEGLLDATHVRFFTLEGALELVAGAGLAVTHVHPIIYQQVDVNSLPSSGLTISQGKMTLANLTREEALRLFAFQYVIIARRAS